MVNRKVVADWLKKADEDLSYAKTCLEEGMEFYSQICFHFHEAIEKYLKTYIVAKELDFKKIHDLSTLLGDCIDNDQEFSMFDDEIKMLAPLYIKARYPEFVINIGKPQAENALKTAQDIASFVKLKLGF